MFSRRVVVSLRFAFPRQPDAAARALLYQTRRTFATPGRPRNVVGEPSKPVKRAVKKSVAKAASADSPAKEGNEVRKRKAAEKPATAKKPAAKRGPKPKVLVELSEEQKAANEAKSIKSKEAKASRLERAKIAELKKVALSPPKIPQAGAYTVFAAEKSRNNEQLHQKGPGGAERLAQSARANSAAWKECTPADVEHYNHLAHTRREAAQAAYKQWVEGYTPEEIQNANRARLTLKRKRNKKGSHTWSQIHDERAVKRPLTTFAQFNVNRQASGDFTNIRLPDRTRLIAQEWKALDQEEKDKYNTLYAEDRKRYSEEHEKVHGHLPPSYQEHPEVAATAAAAA
ncbi:hypothetical protein LTR15_008666 [Elasticomyces elasticus]|nr:hypothetical protein LTR15_008666 [Elasticomyces elasticus]